MLRIGMLVVALIALPRAAHAQHTPAKPGRVAGIAPAPQPAPPQPSAPVLVPPTPILYAAVPVLVTADGRVYADFGYGYEQIARQCPALQAPAPQATPPQATPPATQNQPGITWLVPPPAQPPTLPCWTTDARGQVSVVRR